MFVLFWPILLSSIIISSIYICGFWLCGLRHLTSVPLTRRKIQKCDLRHRWHTNLESETVRQVLGTPTHFSTSEIKQVGARFLRPNFMSSLARCGFKREDRSQKLSLFACFSLRGGVDVQFYSRRYLG